MGAGILTLIKQTRGVDEYGDAAISETSREVFCETASVGMKEFYQAHEVGMQPEIKFVLSDYYDYEGEMLAEHDGVRYRIIRTYRTGQSLELTCTREVNEHVAS